MDRRTAICEAALDLAASGGNHAITHRAIDRRLDLPAGSASYYFRNRLSLIRGAIDRLTERSRSAFTARELPEAITIESAADVMAGYLAELLGDRRRDVRARYALAFDAAADDDLRRELGACLFSQAAANELMRSLGAPEPDDSAADMIVFLEGIVYCRTLGLAPGTTDYRRGIARLLSAQL